MSTGTPPKNPARQAGAGGYGNRAQTQQPRGAQQHEKPRREDKPGRRPEFDQEYEGKNVKITLHNGTTILGKAETSKYWLKIVSASGKCIYVNKAFIVMIEPAE